jgi:serine phosphatase RsbU (regulator of sigma subunit)/anti-sigma regulatory factor (Ser/Thr protein kinase)
MLRQIWQVLTGDEEIRRSAPEPQVKGERAEDSAPFQIAPNDPILHYFQNARGVIDISRLELDSPALQAMKDDGVSIAVPLVSQGELIGLLNLGPRLSEQEYSADDRTLLSNLATQAAPALRVAQLVRQQKEEARARERIEQELRVARLIQQTLLPKELPQLPGWAVSAYYQPASEVGGDFYDFVALPKSQMGIIVADVTDKGVPAALVMATTRSMLRSAAEQLVSPCQVLRRANDLLCDDIPENMFVTCIYAVLNPSTGEVRYANAGHDLPYIRHADGISELYATGMPLGLMPGMDYEEKEMTIKPGETILFHSDGLAEAHNQQREMFGFPRLKEKMAAHQGGPDLINFLVGELKSFTGEGWEQEDDVTLVVLENAGPESGTSTSQDPERRALKGESKVTGKKPYHWETLIEFALPSKPGNERQAIQKVSEALEGLDIGEDTSDRLKTAVGEATMNAMEHGNQYQRGKQVSVQVRKSSQALSVLITDEGGGEKIQIHGLPDLESKLKGEQSPRGWGLFLIQNMVDEMKVINDGSSNTIELIVELEGEGDGE